MTAIEVLVIPEMELAIKPANAPSGRSVDANVLELDQWNILGTIEGLRMTASSRKNSRTDLIMIAETRGNITVEKSDLLVIQKKSDWQTYSHHNHRYMPAA